MKIMITCHLVDKTELSGEYTLAPSTTVMKLCQQLGITWDEEALIVVNDQIIDTEYELQEGDHLYFLIPIAGG